MHRDSDSSRGWLQQLRHSFHLTGLVDCGSTGSCVSRRCVEANNLNTQKVARPIPVYNADGTFNKSGPITDYVEMCMQVQDHSERILLAVADLGKADIFIGHDWLKVHNPTIDWQKGELCFTRCPPRCNYTPRLADLEADNMCFRRQESHVPNFRTMSRGTWILFHVVMHSLSPPATPGPDSSHFTSDCSYEGSS